MNLIHTIRYSILVPFVMLVGGCAFYDKQYVSRIDIEGRNYRGLQGDEGVFYIDNEPLVRLNLGCHQQTMLGQTVFPVIPFPVFGNKQPHESIADEKFSLTLSHIQSVAPKLADLSLSIQFGNNIFPLDYAGSENIEYHIDYNYESNISCGQIKDATLNIQLAENKSRIYSLQFDEKIRRRVRYHAGFVT